MASQIQHFLVKDFYSVFFLLNAEDSTFVIRPDAETVVFVCEFLPVYISYLLM